MRRCTAIVAFLAAVPATAHAHLVQSGFGTFYDGVIHLAITPSDVLLVIGLGLLAGLSGRAEARAVIVALPCAWMIGGIAGMWHATESTLPWLTTLTFGLTGVLVAANAQIPRLVLVLCAASAGLLHGYVNGATMAPGGADWLALVGATATTLVIVTLLGAGVVGLRAHWAHIVVRVAGSWIAAISMLMFGWLFRTG